MFVANNCLSVNQFHLTLRLKVYSVLKLVFTGSMTVLGGVSVLCFSSLIGAVNAKMLHIISRK